MNNSRTTINSNINLRVEFNNAGLLKEGLPFEYVTNYSNRFLDVLFLIISKIKDRCNFLKLHDGVENGITLNVMFLLPRK